MKAMEDFATRLGTSIKFRENLTVKKNRCFLINEFLMRKVQKGFFYAGAYLGKVKHGVFSPSLIFLTMIAEGKANKIMVDKKTEWLFICGRDVFKRGILNVTSSNRKGDYTLILNKNKECLGFGKILCNINEEERQNKVVVKNILDIGDFLRREK